MCPDTFSSGNLFSQPPFAVLGLFMTKCEWFHMVLTIQGLRKCPLGGRDPASSALPSAYQGQGWAGQALGVNAEQKVGSKGKGVKNLHENSWKFG